MAVDRGGLQYSIDVILKGQENLTAFREGILAARAEFAGLQSDLAAQRGSNKAVVASTREVAQELTIQQAAEKKLATEIRNVAIETATQVKANEQKIARTRAVIQQSQLQAAVEAGAAKVARERTKELNLQSKAEEKAATNETKAGKLRQAAAAQLQAQQAAIARTTAAVQQEQRAKALNLQVSTEQLAAQRQFTTKTGELNTQLGKTKVATEAVTASGGRANGAFQSLFFTFRRLIGAFAAFLIVRQVVAGFISLVSESIRFNAQLEQATLGIASVIAATGNISDAMGGAASSAQQFALAQKEAQKQVQKLRADALATNATFEQLLETFQTAIGPGLAAGIDLDEIRKLTVKISQAATAIGLPQNQLAEEIRSILSGTIQLRTTRLAAVLGITNQDIKNAKELGKLTEFLQAKFQAFGTAGEKSLTTFNVILTNLQDALSQNFAAGGAGLFEALKKLFSEVQSAVVDVNAELSTVTLNPKAVEIVNALLDGLRAATEQGRELLQNLNFGDALNIAKGIGDAFAGLAFLLRNAIEILVSGLGRAFKLIELVLDAARLIGKAFSFLTGGSSFFGSLLKGAASLLVTFISIRLILLAVQKILVFTFVTSLGKGVTAALSLFKGLKSIRDVIAGIQLLFEANPIGIALTALSVVAGLLITQFDLLDSFFGGTSEGAADAGAATEKFSKHVAELSGQISGASDVGGKFGEVLKGLQDDLRETLFASQIDISQIGLTGGVQQQAKIAGDALIDIQKKVVELTNDQANAQANLLGVQRQRAELEKTILGTSTFIAARISDASDAAKDQLQISSRQVQVDQDLASARLALDAAREKGAGQEFKDALTRVTGLEREATALGEAAKRSVQASDAVGTFLDQLTKSGQLSKEEADQIKATADQRIDLAGKEVSLGNQINDILGKRTEIEKTILAAAAARASAAAREESFRLQLENNGLAAQAEALRRIAAARTGLFDTDSFQLQAAAAANELRLLQEANSQVVFRNALDRAHLESVVAAAKNTPAEIDLQRQLNDLIQNQANTQEVANLKIADASRLLDLAVFKIQQPVKAGFIAAVDDFKTKAFDDFQNTIDLMNTALQGLTSTLASSLVDAFDPTKKVDIAERFARLFQTIAEKLAEQNFDKILATILPDTASLAPQTIAATEAATIIAGGGTAAGAALIASATTAAAILSGQQTTGAVVSSAAAAFAHGGGTPPTSAAASWAHYMRGVASFAFGGGVRGRTAKPPPGVHPSDRIPAWLQKDEFVHPVSAVRNFGLNFMELVRRNAPRQLVARALMGHSRSIAIARGSAGGGYKSGGLVQQAARAASKDRQAVPVAGPVGAILVASDRAAERFNAGGKTAQRRFLSENRTTAGRRDRPR